MTDADELAAIAALIEVSDERAAFSRLRARMAWPLGKELPQMPTWLGLLSELARRHGAAQLADVALAAVSDPDSPDRLYDLGYALIDAGAPSIAASVLWHCLALVGDSEEVVCELVSALESALAYEDAFEVLEQHAALRTRSFLCEYLYAFNAAMTGRLDTTRTVLARLQPDSPETEQMRATLAMIVERADLVAGATPLDPLDLRGWHFVLTGSLLSHQSPYGFDEPMHGRYAWLQDSLQRIATGIERLVPLVRATKAPCVYAPPGRDHEILARAVSTRLALPLMPWPAIGVPAPGVVVAYDLRTLTPADVARLQQRREDQVFFAHASPWTQDFPIAPDVTTLLYQTLVPPWGESTVVDPETREVTQSAPDPRSAEDVAAELLASPGHAAEGREGAAPSRGGARVRAAWPPAPGPRTRLWAGGPVPSNRFE